MRHQMAFRIGSRITAIALIVGLFGCAPSPNSPHQIMKEDREWSEYGRGQINCKKQSIMTAADCELGLHTKNKPSQKNLDLLKSYGVDTPEKYDAAISEANAYKDYNSTGLSPQQTWPKVISYLSVKKSATEDGVPLVQWLAKAKANAQKITDQMNKDYPLTAELTCTVMNNRTQLSSCFSPNYGRSDGGTVLEITNGKDYKMYQWMQVDTAGVANIKGLVTIPLRTHFKIKAQNNSNNFLLNIVITNSASGAVLYKKSAQQFGWINIAN